MNALCGHAIRAGILALAAWPLVGLLDHERVVAERQLATICQCRPQPLYAEMHRRKAAAAPARR